MIVEKLEPEIAKDLIELINDLGKLPKTSSVKYGNTKFNYVPLDDMLAKIKENKNFAFMQPLGMLEDGTPCIQCILIHKSGTAITSDPYRLVVHPNEKKQMEGAEITYSRRYSLASFLGIASDEDTDATQPAPKPKKKLISDETAQAINEKIKLYSEKTGMQFKEITKELEQLTHKSMSVIGEGDARLIIEYLSGKIAKLEE